MGGRQGTLLYHYYLFDLYTVHLAARVTLGGLQQSILCSNNYLLGLGITVTNGNPNQIYIALYCTAGWLDSVIEATKMNLTQLQEAVEDRRAWCALVHGVTKSRTRLNDDNTVQNSQLEFFCLS